MKATTRKIWRLGTLCRAAILIVTLIALSPSSAFAQGAANTNPNALLPPNFAELSAKWWKWALETPTALNPLIDLTGANCAVGQEGNIWFLAGTFPGVGNVIRTCTVPAGKILFFPVANTLCAAAHNDPAGTRSALFQRTCATEGLIVTNMAVEIDGVPAANLGDYRVAVKGFAILLPADNVFGAPAGSYSPAAADGFYLPVAPLPAGAHTIHIHAEFSGGGVVDVTYYLSILP